MITVVVVGTHTEVGKTWVTAALLRELRGTGVAALARKPVQSFDPEDAHPTDADVLAAAADERPEQVCPSHRWLTVPMAPPMASAVLGRPSPSWAELRGEIDFPVEADVGFVELVGGVRSPVAEDADCVAAVADLEPDHVLLVADAELGTIDRVRLAHEALAPRRPLVVLNRYDATVELHRRNASWLSDRDGVDVVTSTAGVVSALALDSVS
ncbi:MAG: dethiobiotin synthase [Actinomycetota bacterium]